MHKEGLFVSEETKYWEKMCAGRNTVQGKMLFFPKRIVTGPRGLISLVLLPLGFGC